MSVIEEKIKGEVLQVAYGEIDKLYDYFDQRFTIDESQRGALIKQLNSLKDQIYLIAQNSKLS